MLCFQAIAPSGGFEVRTCHIPRDTTRRGNFGIALNSFAMMVFYPQKTVFLTTNDIILFYVCVNGKSGYTFMILK